MPQRRTFGSVNAPDSSAAVSTWSVSVRTYGYIEKRTPLSGCATAASCGPNFDFRALNATIAVDSTCRFASASESERAPRTSVGEGERVTATVAAGDWVGLATAAGAAAPLSAGRSAAPSASATTTTSAVAATAKR